MRYLERFFEVFLFEVLFKNTGVKIVVHLIIEPSKSSILYGLETLCSNGLPIG